jgi:hypothetical protein
MSRMSWTSSRNRATWSQAMSAVSPRSMRSGSRAKLSQIDGPRVAIAPSIW